MPALKEGLEISENAGPVKDANQSCDAETNQYRWTRACAAPYVEQKAMGLQVCRSVSVKCKWKIPDRTPQTFPAIQSEDFPVVTV